MYQKTITLLEVYGMDGELCAYWGLNEQDTPPWSGTDLEISTSYIDKLLFTMYGDRPVNRYIKYYLSDDGTLSAENKQRIARYVMALMKAQWARLTADYTAEYNPVQNYDMTESENATDTASGTDTTTDSFNDYVETTKYGHKVSTTNAAVPYDGSTANTTDTSETTYGDAEDDGDTFTPSGTKSVALQHGKKNTIARTLTRAGNIGVQTATDMLRSDTDFWSTSNFYQQIVADIASLLTIPIYE